MKLPNLFLENMTTLLGNEALMYFEALHSSPSTSIRLNPLKSENELSLSHPVAWCENAFYLSSRPIFTTDPFFHAGHYYVQEASSMIIDVLIRSLNLSRQLDVLDMCAAPGGKSTLLSSYLGTTGFLHCHEFDYARALSLKHNILKWGNPNVAVTTGPLVNLTNTGLTYDVVLVDAPCSGEGMFRKEPKAVEQWSYEKIKRCQQLQKSILQIATHLVKPQGYLIYSTCTFNVEENEMIIKPYIEDLTFNSIPCSSLPPGPESPLNMFTYRMMPHRLNGEGLTVSVLKKNSLSQTEFKSSSSYNAVPNIHQSIIHSQWIREPEAFFPVRLMNQIVALPINHFWKYDQLFKKMKVIFQGIALGEIKGKDFIPDHALSQSVFVSDTLPNIAFSKQEALSYLKCLTPACELQSNALWQIAKYKSANLGWIKHSDSRFKNHYPKQYRILNY